MSYAIHCIEGAHSELPSLKNKLEMNKEISNNYLCGDNVVFSED